MPPSIDGTAMSLPQLTPDALAGLRVVEMGQLIAGPFAGKTLGEFGADVIKIEAPGSGDLAWRGGVPERDASAVGGIDLCGAKRGRSAVYGAFDDFSGCLARQGR